MQKIFTYIIVLLLLVSFCKEIDASENAYFVWEKTTIDVPVNDSLSKYTDSYIVKFYVNGVESNEFTVEKETNCSTFTTVQTNIVGDYHVYYRARSKKYYVYDETMITFHVYDDIPPSIVGPNCLTLEYLDRLTASDYYYVFDNSTKEEELELILDDKNVSYQTIGTYPAQLICSDKSNNVSKKNIDIIIVDTTPPVITINKNLVFSYGKEIDFLSYADIYDTYDGKITDYLLVTDSNLELGDAVITISSEDFSGNIIVQDFNCKIIDDTSPTLDLTASIVDIDISKYNDFGSIDYLDYVYSYYDDYDISSDLYLSYESELIYSIGDYYVTYLLVDTSGNYTEKQVLFRVRETTGPVIEASSNLNFDLNEAIDVEKLVTITDFYDTNAINNLEVTYNNLNPQKAGSYTVKYRCYNNSGRYSTKEITINIVDNNANNIISSFLSSNGLFIIAMIIEAGVFIFVIVKTKNKSDNN